MNNSLFIRKNIRAAVEWLIALAAYAYLVYQLATFDRYSAFAALFSDSSAGQWVCLSIAILLMPLNLYLEGAKWKELLCELHPLDSKEALLQVLYGQRAAFITPYRLGDIPARVMRLNDSKHWKQSLVLGLYGGIIQTVVIIACGIIPAVIFLHHTAQPYIREVCAVAAIALLIPVAMRYKSLPRSIRLTGSQLCNTFVWSTARYTCWIIQFALTMAWAGVCLPLNDVAILIPTYYLLVTVTPNIPIADAGIRGSWAVFTFGLYGVDAPASAIIAITMWLINTLLPVALFLPGRIRTKEKTA
ncbi:MAG: hypothetical protein J6Y00_02525 [Paludibacteraceae bacterium]|nr:hypothetical protein [Paludibacteraceae bacterium]